MAKNRLKPIQLSTIRPGHWLVRETYQWRHIIIPKGFVTDLDSVPRVPIVYSRVKGRTVTAAVIHDYCYRVLVKERREMTRKRADALFLEAMKEEGVSWVHRAIIHRAVRLFGGVAIHF